MATALRPNHLPTTRGAASMLLRYRDLAATSVRLLPKPGEPPAPRSMFFLLPNGHCPPPQPPNRHHVRRRQAPLSRMVGALDPTAIMHCCNHVPPTPTS
ncbi:hypothetical protein ZWY2020_051600 [Hordeum vulgare]|nr:hypothetical protein ZWY2020_051600 [Hordeum vulgare]